MWVVVTRGTLGLSALQVTPLAAETHLAAGSGVRPRCGMIGRFVQSSRAGSSNRTAGAVETGGFRPRTYTLDWDEPSIVGP
jgi:hypothetical protein